MHQKRLEYFLTLCRVRNITRAATELFLTRQAISNCIRDLEEEVGAQLFTRSKEGVALTEAGALFKEFVDRDAQLWSEMLERIQSVQTQMKIRIGTHLMHAGPDLIHMITSFEGENTNTRISFHDSEDSSTFFQMLREDSLDIALTRKAPAAADLRFIKLRDLKVFALVSSQSDFRSQTRIDFMNDMNGETYLTVSLETLEEIRQYLETAGMEFEYIVPNTTLLKELIENNRGFFVAPEFAVPKLLTNRIIAREIYNYPLVVGSYLVFRSYASSHVKRFIDYMLVRVAETNCNKRPCVDLLQEDVNLSPYVM
jgi:DNA-binding transcriptional LysR family regulator